MALTTLSLFVAKGVGLLTALISVPLTVGYLGTERYGLWMTISSVIALLGFADLGMGNGLVNAISEADGKEDREAARKYVSSGFFMLLGTAVFILATFAVVYPFVPWSRVFNVASELAARESGPAMAVFISCFAINMPLGVVQRVQLGYQEGFTSNLWQSAGSLLGLGGVLLTVYLKAGLPWLVLAMAGAPALATASNWLVEFGRSRLWLFPRWGEFDWTAGRRVVGIGLVFLVLQVMALVGGDASDNLVIAQVLGASAVVSYAVTQKLFSIALLTQLFFTPLWPAFGEALAREDITWVRRTLDRSIALSMSAGAVVALPFVMVGQQIVTVWVGSSVVPPVSLLIGFACLVLMHNYKGCISTFFNSGPFLHRQVIFFAAASLVSLILKIVLCSYWQATGIVWATILGYGLLYLFPMTIIVRKLIYVRPSTC